MKDHSDIIDHPCFKSPSHPPMSMESRAAQFAPFAALTGFDEAISETARQVVLAASRQDTEPVTE